jgi:hypothetical protein
MPNHKSVTVLLIITETKDEECPRLLTIFGKQKTLTTKQSESSTQPMRHKKSGNK